jgi:hypothetical protein
MDYGDILKRAWNVTWRYKALWVLGFFVGGAAGGTSGSRTSSTTGSTLGSGGTAGLQSFLAQYGALILVGLLAAAVVGLLFMVVALAARGGLIHLVNEAEEGRPVKLGDGWRAGFSKWGRLFGVSFLAALPILIIVAIVLAIIGASAFSAFQAYTASGSTQTLARSFAGPLLGASCFVIILLIAAAFLGVVLSIAASLGLRYVMLEDRRAVASLKQGWDDLWTKRGAFVMFLIVTAVGIVFGIVVGVVGGIAAVTARVLSGTRVIGATASLAGLVALLLIVPASIYGTFIDAVWTIFFRRMTGLQAAPALQVAAPQIYPEAGTYIPPAPPMPPVPAPPVPPVSVPAPPAPFDPSDVPPPPAADV